MKTIIVTVALVFTSLTFAQKGEMKRERMKPEEKIEKQLEKMTSELNLTDEQQQKIKPLLEAQSKNREAKKEEMKDLKANGEKLSPEDRLKMREEMKENQSEMKNNLAKILSAEQMEKWENHQNERKEKMKERLKERKSKK